MEPLERRDMAGTYTNIIIYYWASELQFKIAMVAHGGTHSFSGVPRAGFGLHCAQNIFDKSGIAFLHHVKITLYYHCLMSRSQLKVPRMVLPASSTFSGFDNKSPVLAHMNAGACWSTLTTSMDTSDKMACLSALVPSLSSNDSHVGYALIKVRISSILGGSPHELSHTRISGVLPSTSCTKHAAGYASASNYTMDSLARVPTAIQGRSVQPTAAT